MRRSGLLLWTSLVFLLPRLANADVVIETVDPGSAPEKAGAREGDVFHTWTRLPNPPIHPEPASGTLESPFDWLWMEIEHAPRGTVELQGERQGEPLVLQVPIGPWGAQVKPVLPADLEDLYRQGRELVDKEQVAEGAVWWRQLAERAKENGDGRLACWMWLRIGLAWRTARIGEQAEAAFEAALRESQDPLSRIEVLEAMGETYEDQQNLDKAEASYRSALELMETTWGESLQTARGRYHLGWATYRRSLPAPAPEQKVMLTAAWEQMENALAVQEKLALGGLAVAKSLDGLGSIALARGESGAASVFFAKSVTISETLQPDSLSVATTLYRMGNVESDKGAFESAQTLYRRALAIVEKGKSPTSLMASILNNLGILMMARGDLASAEDYLRRALTLKNELSPVSLSLATTLDNLGGVAQLRENWDLAGEYFERALRLRSSLAPGSQHVARSLSLLGGLSTNRGDYVAAERYLREALALYERTMPEDPVVGYALMSLGDAFRGRGDLAQAEIFYKRSLEHRKQWKPSRVSEVLYLLGVVAIQRGDMSLAEDYFRKALANDDKYSSVNWEHASLLHAMAKLLRDTGRLKQAARYAELSIETLETQVGKLGGSLEAQGEFRGSKGDIYRDALRLQLDLGHPREAFHLLERFRAQAFLALLAERDLSFTADLSPDLDRERRRGAALYDRNQLRLAELDPEKDREAIESLNRKQAELRRRREEIAAEIRRAAPRLARLREPQALTFEEVQTALDSGTVMLSYSVGKEQTHLFLVTPGKDLQVKTLEVGQESLQEDVDRFRRLIDQTQDGAGLGAEGLAWISRKLYRLLIEPVEPWVAAGNRIVLVPDGPLHLLPFAALVRNDGRYLVEWKPLSTVLSGTVLAELRRQGREADTAADPASRPWVAFGDPWFPPRLAESRPEEIGDVRLRSLSTRTQIRWKRLPESRREVEEIAALFPADRSQAYVDRAATEERAKALGREPRIVHFATHGFVDDRSPFDSGLVLSIPDELTEGRDNGLLQVWEIFESVRLDADLVVLSACETGIGEIRGGEGIIGLTRAFQYAGARSVLASLWRVEDLATAELMQRFYRHLRAGKPKDEALRAAQLELLQSPLRVLDGHGGWSERNAAAPYFWAALQLVGDGR